MDREPFSPPAFIPNTEYRQVDPNQQPVPHLIPGSGGCAPGTQVQGGSASLHHVPAFPWPMPGYIAPEPMCPPQPGWLTSLDSISDPRSHFDPPDVLVTVEVWCNKFLPPGSVLLLPEVPHQDCCLCPQAVPVCHPCSPDLVPRRATKNSSKLSKVRPEPAAPRSEQNQEEAKPEETEQISDRDNPPQNITDVQTNSKVSPGPRPSLGDDSVTEGSSEEHVAIVDSISTKAQEEDVNAKDNQNQEDTELSSLLQYLNELCTDEDFIKDSQSTLNLEYLESILSADPEPIDLLAQETPDQQERQLSDDSVDPMWSTQKSLDSPASPDPSASDFLPLREAEQEQVHLIMPQFLHPVSDDTGSTAPVTEETSLAASHVEVLDPLWTQSDRNPANGGENSPPRARHSRSNTSSPLLHSLSLQDLLPINASPTNPISGMSPLYDGSIFRDYSFNSTLQVLQNVPSDRSLTFDLGGEDSDALAEELLAEFSTEYLSEAAVMSLSTLMDAVSAQISPKLHHTPPSGNPPPASESPSTPSASGPSEDLNTKGQAPTFGGDVLTVGPSVPSVMLSPPAQITETKTRSIINLESLYLEENAVLAPVESSFVADSHAESCEARVDGNSPDREPERQTVEPQIDLQVPQEVASSGVSSGELSEQERKREKRMGKAAAITATQKPREDGAENTLERKEEKKENRIKPKRTKDEVHVRYSLRLAGQIGKEKARLSGELSNESEESPEKTTSFTAESGEVTCEKQARCSSGGRRLYESMEGSQATNTANREEKLSEIGEMDHQKLELERGEQCGDSNPNTSLGNWAEDAPLTTQNDKAWGEGMPQGRNEGIQMSSVARRTRSMTRGGNVQPTPLPVAGEKVKPSETERHKIKVSPEVEMQGGDRQENAIEPLPQPVSSPVPTYARPGSIPLHSLRAQADTQLKDSLREGQLNESHSSKSSERNSLSDPAECPETLGGRQEVVETKTFYSLRSQTTKPNVSNCTEEENLAVEPTDHPRDPRPSPDQAGDEEERPSLLATPTKRHRHECGAAEGRDVTVTETETIVSSPVKRGRWKETEVKSGRDEEEKLPATEETPDCESRTVRITRKTKDEKLSSSPAGRGTSGNGKSCLTETRARCRSPPKRQRQIPAKYTDFIQLKTNGLNSNGRQRRTRARK